MGSSPLARGTPSAIEAASRTIGLIPAHAGKHTTVRVFLSLSGGSSPLTRGPSPLRSIAKMRPGLIPAHAGNTPWRLPHTATGGLIPAHAGNTPVRMMSTQVAWAHPRSRGEHIHKPGSEDRPAGSSPLTRGTPIHHWHESAPARLIPAHAGNTLADKARHPTEEQKIFSFHTYIRG